VQEIRTDAGVSTSARSARVHMERRVYPLTKYASIRHTCYSRMWFSPVHAYTSAGQAPTDVTSPVCLKGSPAAVWVKHRSSAGGRRTDWSREAGQVTSAS
jgi:hypothetical protein